MAKVPALHSNNHKEYFKVYETLKYWQQIVRAHLDYFVAETATEFKIKDEEPVSKASEDNDEDDFWSDFSDNDFDVDESQQKQQLDILFNLLEWL